MRKPYAERSAKFQWWAETKNRHNARWNFLGDGHFEHGHYVVPTKGAGIFGHCTHILCDAARIGNLFYQEYLFTGDRDWLRDRTYPIIKGAAEFYRNFPNFKKGDDGLYHIHHVNNNESGWDTSDTPMEIAGMRQAFSLAIRIATILDADSELRSQWQDILDNLAPAANSGRGRRPATTDNGSANQIAGRQAGGSAPPGANGNRAHAVARPVEIVETGPSARSFMAARAPFPPTSPRPSLNRASSVSTLWEVSSTHKAPAAPDFSQPPAIARRPRRDRLRTPRRPHQWRSFDPAQQYHGRNRQPAIRSVHQRLAAELGLRV